MAEFYCLEARYDARASFYGKARVEVFNNGDKNLYSYDTRVASIIDGKPVVFGEYSSTTSRHIKEFLLQNGFTANSTKQIMNDYSTDDFEKNMTKFLKAIDKCDLFKINTDGDINDIGSIDEVFILDIKNNPIIKFIRDKLVFNVYFDTESASVHTTIDTGYTLKQALNSIINFMEDINEELAEELRNCIS